MDQDAFLAAALRNPVHEIIANELFRLMLPDAWIVSGCLVQTVWNVLTKRAVDYGIADYDVFYFDPDTSWQAEDAVIRKLQGRFAATGAKVEVRNQARVPPMASTAFSPKIPRSESAARGTATTSMRRMDLTISPAWSCGPTRERIFRRQTMVRRQGAGKVCGGKSQCCRRTACDAVEEAQLRRSPTSPRRRCTRPCAAVA